MSHPARAMTMAALALVALAAQADAHGAQVAAEPVQAVAVQARYDTGAPMAGAQVVIYAPNDPAAIWARGLTDDAGRHLFTPDPTLPGRWTVQVRQAGHGAIVHIDSTPGGTQSHVATSAPVQGPLQRLVMVALVAWGALGTALYVRSRHKGARDASA